MNVITSIHAERLTDEIFFLLPVIGLSLSWRVLWTLALTIRFGYHACGVSVGFDFKNE